MRVLGQRQRPFILTHSSPQEHHVCFNYCCPWVTMEGETMGHMWVLRMQLVWVCGTFAHAVSVSLWWVHSWGTLCLGNPSLRPWACCMSQREMLPHSARFSDANTTLRKDPGDENLEPNIPGILSKTWRSVSNPRRSFFPNNCQTQSKMIEMNTHQ